MKTATLIGLSLTLLMLLLVLLAAFLFLFQGRQAIEAQYETQSATLEQKAAENELLAGSLEGTRMAVERQILTPQAAELEALREDNRLLNQEAVADQQELEQLRALVTQTADGTLPTLAAPEAVFQPAIVELLAPSSDETFPLDEPIEMIIAARDDRGIDKIELMINEKVEATIQGNGQTFVTDKRLLSFASEGGRVLEVKLTNLEGGVTMTQLIRINVVLPSDNGG